MKKIVIVGAGTAGTMMANHLSRRVDLHTTSVTVIDPSPVHYYQPGFLFIPFGVYSRRDVVKNGDAFIPNGVSHLAARVACIEPENNRVVLADGTHMEYHALIVATGSRIEPEEIDGLVNGGWRRTIFDFYTLEGAMALHDKLRDWRGGRLAVHLAEMPIKCPVAPLEFAFLADAYFRTRRMRDHVDMTYVTPLPGAFTKPRASEVLGHLLADKKIDLVPEFAVERVDADAGRLVSYDGKTVDFDLLVTVPTNMGDPVIGRSGLGDDLRFIPTDRHTLQAKKHENIFVIGDATDLPSSKAGSVAHFQSEVLVENIVRFLGGRPLLQGFNGHANCFIESGGGKAFLIDFDYDHEPLEGRFPFSRVGPFSLLKETRVNHWGKLAFRWIYWNVLLRGRRVPGIRDPLPMADSTGKQTTKG